MQSIRSKLCAAQPCTPLSRCDAMPARDPASLCCYSRHPLTFARSVPCARAGDARRRRLVLELDQLELACRPDRVRRHPLVDIHAELAVQVEEEPAPVLSTLLKRNPAACTSAPRGRPHVHARVVQRPRGRVSPRPARACSMSRRMYNGPSGPCGLVLSARLSPLSAVQSVRDQSVRAARRRALACQLAWSACRGVACDCGAIDNPIDVTVLIIVQSEA